MQDATGLKCSTCWGRGLVEPTGATRWDYRTPAYLAAGLAALTFVLLFVTYNGNGEAFNKSLIFAGTLLGSITGYYFGGQKRLSAGSGEGDGKHAQTPPAGAIDAP